VEIQKNEVDTYRDSQGVRRIERREDNCTMHESHSRIMADHETRIRLLETLTTTLLEQNRTQFRILEEVKSGIDKMNGKQLAIAAAVILFLITQLMPYLSNGVGL